MPLSSPSLVTPRAPLGAMPPAVLAGAPLPWNPLVLPQCVLWLSANGLDAQNAAPAVKVPSWADLSAVSGPATIFSSGTAGYVRSGVLSTRARTAVRYDTTDFHLLPTIGNGAKSFLLVLQFVGLPANATSCHLFRSKASSTSFSALLYDNAVGGYQTVNIVCDISGTTNSVGTATTLSVGQPYILCVTYSGGTNTATGSYAMTINGVTQTLLASGAIGLTGTDLGSLGGRVSSVGGITGGANMYVSQMMVYSRQLAAWEMTLATRALAPYYGLAVA